ncbi:MAG: hypothetical protein RBR87_15940 [Bacteroidales bacterium]|nr:hypothetical protein [Bacteroidales bacterium]
MRNSEIELGVDFQGNSAMISMAFEKDYGLLGKQLLGCGSSKTTEIVAQASKKELEKAINLLDDYGCLCTMYTYIAYLGGFRHLLQSLRFAHHPSAFSFQTKENI